MLMSRSDIIVTEIGKIMLPILAEAFYHLVSMLAVTQLGYHLQNKEHPMTQTKNYKFF